MAEQAQVDLHAIEKLKEMMRDKFPHLVEVYCTNAEKYIQEIEQGFEQKDPKKIRDAAHPLKGSSGNLGLGLLHDAAEALEDASRDVEEGSASFDVLTEYVTGIKRLCEESVAALQQEV